MSNVIGLLPAGGQATRLSPLPLSKELYPLGFRKAADGRTVPKVVSHYLLEKMQQAGIGKAFFILRSGKWDIPAYYGDGELVQMRLGYLTVHVPYGVPYTLDQAYPFLQGATVAIGFPDILFQPENAYSVLLERLAQRGADVVLGLFPTEHFRKAGMVQFDAEGRVQRIVEKPQQTDLQYMWAIAVWSPRFTEFLHEFVNGPVPETEVPIGDVIQAGIHAGLRVEAEAFPNGSYLDVGTPDDLARAIRRLTPVPD